MSKISLYVPAFQSEIRLTNELEFEQIVVADNGGSDVREEPNLLHVRHPENLGRLGNWEYCVQHFIESDATWLKWLFAGDRLLPGARARLERAMQAHPEARLIIGEYYIVHGNQRIHWRMVPETRMIQPQDAMWLSAERGNWFGSPVGYCVHKEAVQDGFDFGGLPWVADWQFCLNIAAEHPVLYLAEPLGEFHVSARQYYLAQSNQMTSLLEEGLIYHQAAQKYKALTGNEAGYNALVQHIDKGLEARLVQRRVGMAQSVDDVMHLLNPMVAANIIS